MSYLYAIRYGRYVKIGYSDSPRDRLRALPGGVRLRPADLELSTEGEPLFAVTGDLTTERLLHRIFSPHRAVGEWFILSEEAIELLRSANSDDQRYIQFGPLPSDLDYVQPPVDF